MPATAEYDVAALEMGHDVVVAGVLEARPQVGHTHPPVLPEIDGPNEGDEGRHAPARYAVARIRFTPDDLTVEVGAGTTLLKAAIAAGLPHAHVCGGNARCSTCRVLVVNGLEHCDPRERP